MSAHPGLIKYESPKSIETLPSIFQYESQESMEELPSILTPSKELPPSPALNKTEITSSENEKSMTPILLAAANGYWEVLESITTFYDQPNFNRNSNSNHNPFDVSTDDTKENVLHLLLKRPFIGVRKIVYFYMDIWGGFNVLSALNCYLLLPSFLI